MRHTTFADSSAAAPAAAALAPARSLRESVFRKANYTEGRNTDLRATVTQHSLGSKVVAHQATLLDLPS